jgi:hypothetical protein
MAGRATQGAGRITTGQALSLRALPEHTQYDAPLTREMASNAAVEASKGEARGGSAHACSATPLLLSRGGESAGVRYGPATGFPLERETAVPEAGAEKRASAYPVPSGGRSTVGPVPRPEFPHKIMEFQERFATEAACLEYLAASRWPEGFACPGCGAGRAWVLERRHLWECASCRLQTSVTAGTVMHGTRTPLRVWFWAAYLVATHHPGISAKQLQRQLGLSRYETAWLILQKLRRAMVAPEREPLKDEVEVDEFFLGGLEEGKRGGRQRGKKALVAVAIEARRRGSGRLRLQVLADASGEARGAFVKDTTARGAIVHTDGWPSYRALPKLGYDHRAHVQRSAPAGQEPYLPRAHRAISNLKAWMHGTHRGVGVPTYRSTSTSTSSATTAAAPRWPPSRPCSGSAPSTGPAPTSRSRDESKPQPEQTGYALASL